MALILLIRLSANCGAQVATTMSHFGSPLPEAEVQGWFGNAPDLRNFAAGQGSFTEVFTLPHLGPIFNGRSCAGCHFQPALGGSGGFIQDIRVRDDPTGNPLHTFAVDNLLRGGVQTQGGTVIFRAGLVAAPLGCQLTSPGCQLSACQKEEAARTGFINSLPICDPTSAAFAGGANCTAQRQPPALFGLGMVEATDDATFVAIAGSQPPSIRGVVKWVVELGRKRVARFGWKDDAATLRIFAGRAYLHEIGITSPDFPSEVSNCALLHQQFGVLLQDFDDPEDTVDPLTGRAVVDQFVDFIRALDTPPRPLANISPGGAILFGAVGCAGCHTPAITTAANPALFIPPTTGGVPITSTLSAILARQTYRPYSDFLLHDMGALGDGIASGVAGPRMMRTAPLWGVRAKSSYLHDGRAGDLVIAIVLHDGQAKASAKAFEALSPQQQTQLINFLGTL